ncbi:MAG TPA: PASTA domain-containing protein [Gemmatimonadales bacterium]|nr:PASTA domain-containing protein [Gemmatimonadales bacterium]
MKLSSRYAALLVLSMLGGACSTPFARLDGVVVDARPALPAEYDRIQVTRKGAAKRVAPKMSIEKGDGLMTASDGAALLTLRDGYEVIIEPGTDATIENPSIFVRFGKLIVKVIKEVKEKLTVNSEFTSAGVEGTEFVYEVTRDQTVHIAVLIGRVTVSDKRGGWAAVSYTTGQAGTIRRGAAPSRMGQIDPATEQAIRRRIQVVEGIARPGVPDLRGMREEDARGALEANGLRLGAINRLITRKRPAGIIINTRPVAGTLRKAGDRIALDVEDSSLVVPRMMGRSLVSAQRLAFAAGFGNVDTSSFYSPDNPVGNVIGVSPNEGSAVSATTRIRLTVVTHTPPPQPPPSAPSDTTGPGVCIVPNLIGSTEQNAQALLIRAHLTLGKVRHMESGNTVTQQSAGARRPVKCGASIDITIGSVGE